MLGDEVGNMLNKYDMSEKLVRTGFSYEQSNTIAEVIVQSIREVEMQKKAERNNKIKSILEGTLFGFFIAAIVIVVTIFFREAFDIRSKFTLIMFAMSLFYIVFMLYLRLVLKKLNRSLHARP
ncbi:hypothetical protein [Gallibacterium anatis]|uniref:hypothetical protein n=3 Tax=Gallibacterium anatis TaxID=750 RepID=UPI0012D352D7|nr:hypothetical protein [Gallibacterium anatis]